MSIETFEFGVANAAISAPMYGFLVVFFFGLVAIFYTFGVLRYGTGDEVPIWVVVSGILSSFMLVALMLIPKVFPNATPYIEDRRSRDVSAVVAIEDRLGGRWKSIDPNDYELVDAGIADGTIDLAGHIGDKICTARYTKSNQVQLRCVKS